ncbi:MAG: Ig domain-containing protein [Paludibacteraceae bacterium]
MKKLSSLFMLLCASVMMFATDYVKVTTAPTNWSGEYLLVYEQSATEAYVFNGLDAVNGYTEAAIADGKITVDEAVTITLAQVSGGYSVIVNGSTNNGKYFNSATNTNALGFGTSAATMTMSLETDGVKMANAGGAIMRFNATANQMRFRFYKSTSYTSQKPVQLYKKAASSVSIPATNITLDQTSLSMEQYKNTIALNVTVEPANSTDEVVWTTSDATIATINKGIITALKEGNVTLTATAGEKSATCELTVTAPTILTCEQAAEKALAVSANNEVAEGGMYVIRGYVTATAPTKNNPDIATDLQQYGNYSIWLADERGTAKIFEGYQVAPTDGAYVAEVGDYVEIVGDLTKYNTTAETTGKGSAKLRFIEKAPILYELNGGVLASTPAPATTNEALWKLFMPEYNTYYNLNRSEQPIDKVTTFANAQMQAIMTDAKSGWKWLGDYVLSVATAQSYTVDTESAWRWTMHAFFNCSPAASLTVKVAGFDEAGKPEKWIAAWDATHTATLPERPTEATELPVPTREGYVFAGWYNNAEFTGEAITTVDATTKGTLYAKWEVEAIPATAIEMSEIGLNLTVGETFTLTVTVTPEDASLEGLTWTSSDETLATVKDGVVTAVAPTPAYEYVTITATLGELTATCDVAIYAALESIKFNTTEMDTEFEYEEGLEISLTFDIQPANASTDGIIVTSSNTAVATITEQSFFGMTFFSMNVVGVGTTTLKVTTADGKLSDELVITVTPPAVHATAVTVDKETLTLNVGDTYQLVATMTPEDAVDVIEWNSSKSGVATVENGLVTAVGVGEATIWITAGWEASATCKVTVNDKGTGLENIAELDTNAPIYNVLGQEVSADYKGVVIQNGKKFLLQ